MIEEMRAFRRALKGWRTLAVSVLIAVVGVLETTDWASVVAPEHVGPTMLAIALVVAVLRALTTTPVGHGNED